MGMRMGMWMVVPFVRALGGTQAAPLISPAGRMQLNKNAGTGSSSEAAAGISLRFARGALSDAQRMGCAAKNLSIAADAAM